MRLPLELTRAFVESYDAVPEPDVEAVNRMLDDLEERHDQPEMRNIIHIGLAVLFATPRIYAPGSVYRITWCYDNRNRPSAIACITVASLETQGQPRPGAHNSHTRVSQRPRSGGWPKGLDRDSGPAIGHDVRRVAVWPAARWTGHRAPHPIVMPSGPQPDGRFRSDGMSDGRSSGPQPDGRVVWCLARRSHPAVSPESAPSDN